MRFGIAALLLAAWSTAACSGDDSDARMPRDAARTGNRPLGGAVVEDTMSDGQVLALVTLINNIEAGTAKAIQPKLTWTPARQYAAMILADHQRLATTMPARPEGDGHAPGQAATMLAVFQSQGHMLGTLPAGLPFDATFLALQIADHVTAMDSLYRWQQVARDPALRNAIAGALPVIQAHRARAEALYAALDRTMQTGGPGQDTLIAPPPMPVRTPEREGHHGGEVPAAADTAPTGGRRAPADTAAVSRTRPDTSRARPDSIAAFSGRAGTLPLARTGHGTGLRRTHR